MDSDHKRARAAIYEVLEVQTRPKEPLTVTEWANRYRWFAHGQSWKSQHGNARYDIRDAPFQQEPQSRKRCLALAGWRKSLTVKTPKANR